MKYIQVSFLFYEKENVSYSEPEISIYKIKNFEQFYKYLIDCYTDYGHNNNIDEPGTDDPDFITYICQSVHHYLHYHRIDPTDLNIKLVRKILSKYGGYNKSFGAYYDYFITEIDVPFIDLSKD